MLQILLIVTAMLVAVAMAFPLAHATPIDDAAFWWTAGSCLSLIIMHGIYWMLTHPVNNFWLKGVKLDRASSSFFAAFRPKHAASRSWTALRDRWEYSHLVRSVFGVISLFLLLIAITR